MVMCLIDTITILLLPIKPRQHFDTDGRTEQDPRIRAKI